MTPIFFGRVVIPFTAALKLISLINSQFFPLIFTYFSELFLLYILFFTAT